MDLLKSRPLWCSVLAHGLALGGIWGTTFLLASKDEAGFLAVRQEAMAEAHALEKPPEEVPEPELDVPPPELETPEPEPDLLHEEPPAVDLDWTMRTTPPPVQPHLLIRPSEPETSTPVDLQPQPESNQETPPEAEETLPAEDTVEDAKAWVLHGPPPTYPRRASARRLTGTVVLLVTVDEQGAVTTVEVEQTSGHAILDQAAERALKLWRFRVKQVKGSAALYQARARIQFVHPDA